MGREVKVRVGRVSENINVFTPLYYIFSLEDYQTRMQHMTIYTQLLIK